MPIPRQSRYHRDALLGVLLDPRHDADVRRVRALLAGVDASQVEGYEVTALVRRRMPACAPLLAVLTDAPELAGLELLSWLRSTDVQARPAGVPG